MSSRLKKLGIVVSVLGLLFIGGAVFAFVKVSQSGG